MIETAIRNAFEKGNADDPDFRQKVYRSAYAALDRALKANPGVTVEAAIARRKNLQSKIAEIESEFIPAIMPVAAPPPPAATPRAPVVEPAPPPPVAPPVFAEAPPVAAPRAVEPEPPGGDFDVAPEPVAPSRVDRVEPVLDAPPGGQRREPEIAFPTMERPLAGDAPALDPASDRAASPGGDFDIPAQTGRPVRERRRRPLAVFFIIVTLLALIGIGGWWAVRTGLIKLPGELTGEVPNPPVTTEEEDFDPDEEEIGKPALPGEADSRNWVSVFTPADPTLVSAPGDTRAEVMQDDSGSFMRIRSSASGSAIVFDVGQGILEQLAGKKAAFDIVARASDEGKETQISVICNFGELGDCGRKRYAVGGTKSDYLFEIDLPAKSPGAGGTIAINSDIEGGGKAIDIYEIRVAVSQ